MTSSELLAVFLLWKKQPPTGKIYSLESIRQRRVLRRQKNS